MQVRFKISKTKAIMQFCQKLPPHLSLLAFLEWNARVSVGGISMSWGTGPGAPQHLCWVEQPGTQASLQPSLPLLMLISFTDSFALLSHQTRLAQSGTWLDLRKQSFGLSWHIRIKLWRHVWNSVVYGCVISFLLFDRLLIPCWLIKKKSWQGRHDGPCALLMIAVKK